MRRIYRMHDAQPNGVVEIDSREADAWNKKGFGIFWSVNSFNGARRIENLEHIDSWAVDMDDGTKEEQRERIKRGLTPSKVVETKRGHQVYFDAQDAKPEHWNALVLDRLVPYYGADKNARDLARILRVPGFLHLKDPADPFLVKLVFRHTVAYTEHQIANWYPTEAKVDADRAKHATAKRELKTEGDDFWERVFNLDCEEALNRLSGSGVVGGERFEFKQNASGTKNILVDGKGTSCWIDRSGRIGSLDKGGPTVYQWLRWYGTKPRDAAEIIKRTFPELERR